MRQFLMLIITHVATILIFDVESDTFKATVKRNSVKMCAEFSSLSVLHLNARLPDVLLMTI
jgi:hypothetical protein